MYYIGEINGEIITNVIFENISTGIFEKHQTIF